MSAHCTICQGLKPTYKYWDPALKRALSMCAGCAGDMKLRLAVI